MRSVLFAAAVGGMLLLHGAAARAKDVVVLCSTGLKPALEALRASYQAASGDRLLITFEPSALLKARLDAGAPFDVAVLTPVVIAQLVRQGRVSEGSARVIARAGVGLAVAKGAARPDISTVEALRGVLLTTPSIAYTAGAQSGLGFLAAVEKMGLTQAVRAKFRTMPGSAAEAVAHGDVKLAAQMVPDLVGVAGVDVVGPLPDALQSYIMLSAGVSAAATDRGRAEALVRFLQSPRAVEVIKTKGLEPG